MNLQSRPNSSRQRSKSQRSGKRLLRSVLLLPLALAVGVMIWCRWVYVQIERFASQDQAAHADAIAVFGAAEYDGKPSPVFRARLDHAYDLFRTGIAPVVITTGGYASDPNFSEGGGGHDYLMRRGI